MGIPRSMGMVVCLAVGIPLLARSVHLARELGLKTWLL